MTSDEAVIGVSDHAGWAVLTTVAGGGECLDSRRIELIGDGLPRMPHHHDALRLPLDQALDLVERVRLSAERHAERGLAAVAATVADAVGADVRGVALRRLQPLPPTTAERLQDYRSQNVADWVMYRKALADAAEQRGWTVHWYDARTVLDLCKALHGAGLDGRFAAARKRFGPPWTGDHRLAMAAATVAVS